MNRTVRDLVTDAYSAALSPDEGTDCITITFDGDDGGFIVEFATFGDEPVFNVCNLDSHQKSKFVATVDSEVVDDGRKFVVFESASASTTGHVDELEEIVSAFDAEVGGVERQNLRGWPDWWPSALTA